MSEAPVAVLTGGAQGLGAAFCDVLLDKGYKVCVADVQEEKGKQFVTEQQKKYGAENVKFVVCDVTKEDDYEKLFQFALKEFKKIDLVLNNAGVISEHNPKKTIAVNLMGPFTGCQLAFKYMGKSNGGKGGMVINTASVVGFLPYHALPIYVASKHGVIGLTRSYGTPYHLERDGILFSAICPSFTDTKLLSKCSTDSLIQGFDPIKEHSQELMSFMSGIDFCDMYLVPFTEALKFCFGPEYVAKGILKLLEDKINGSTLLVTRKGYTYIGYQDEFKDVPI